MKNKKQAEEESTKISVKEANKLMPKGKKVHTFAGGGMMLLGCDMDRKEILAKFEAQGGADIAGPNMTNMGHGLAFFSEVSGWVFVETIKKEV